MAQLERFRLGWQNENLARFLLSKLAFIAQPSTVADDIGTDFYCTLFTREAVGEHYHLHPKNAFVIQIKSSSSSINATKKAAFLEQLELPFFVGTVDPKRLALRIYSGRGLQLIFTLRGVPKKLIIKLTGPIRRKIYEEIISRKKKFYRVLFPLIAEIKSTHGVGEVSRISGLLAEECSRIHGNIASRRVSEFILEFSKDDKRIFAGAGSAGVFRKNFALRLSEVFYNLAYILKKQPSKFSVPEFLMYSKVLNLVRNYLPEEERRRVQRIYRHVVRVNSTRGFTMPSRQRGDLNNRLNRPPLPACRR